MEFRFLQNAWIFVSSETSQCAAYFTLDRTEMRKLALFEK